jgi:flavin reductase (DIM6/NTAB) family NADH-FMN oxidoreductase RutF
VTASDAAHDAFDRIVGNLDYPMFVVTVAADGERSGCLVGFAAQCSIDPPRFFVWVSKKNHTSRVADRSPVFALHVLRRGDLEIARLFGEHSGDEIDKFARCDWQPGPGGVPVLTGYDWFAGRVVDRTDSGDHVGYLLDLLDDGCAERADEPQLGFQDVRDFDPGHDA